jgi:hypothetical protein
MGAAAKLLFLGLGLGYAPPAGPGRPFWADRSGPIVSWFNRGGLGTGVGMIGRDRLVSPSRESDSQNPRPSPPVDCHGWFDCRLSIAAPVTYSD